MENTTQPANSVNQVDHTWKILAHASVFLGLIIPVPFGTVIGPLLVYLIKKETDPETADYAKEALNFSITIAGAAFVSGLLVFLLIGFPLMIAVAIYGVVNVVKALIAASKGEFYTYPYTLRLVK